MIYDFSFQNRFTKIKRYEIAARKLLGVNEDDPEWIIRNNYLKLAKKYHPDINKKSEELFRDINTAYMILTKKDFDVENAKFLTISEDELEELEKEYAIERKTADYYSYWKNRFF
ncbi:DnaJ domain-containing protein [Hippea maritima]|uniref:Heat shock protein DnaJ domain protein n=1 Tax=Hippea maritima (strain ATCC 700847 / DSM 10411 / MH2) TaxID=760142 RepID=F2LUF1_HIPMA|nr:DnaJ domain-containing protein [Hippea maritima]AEA33477.1 heat shock protein DnaJ domain protein [Hippea maritima DSM 10411]